MNFRTELTLAKDRWHQISHDDKIVMLGSCFTDNVGDKLEKDGFEVVHNPMGPLYNPVSMLNSIKLALRKDEDFTFREDSEGNWHCLDFASRYSSKDLGCLKETLSCDLKHLGDSIRNSTTVILTFGTSYVYEMMDTGKVVGNCHKFPPQVFNRRRLEVEEVKDSMQNIIELLPENVNNIILTVSPIRHVGDGLHNNQLSKSTLLLAAETQLDDARVHYFPSYEIMMDDLRDYRFYASDMKHPSEVAVNYMYEKFSEVFFSKATVDKSLLARKENLRLAHRPIL